MKLSLKWLLVLFIGMISLTSFGTTADDTKSENDIIVDVGNAFTDTIIQTVSVSKDVINDNFIVKDFYFNKVCNTGQTEVKTFDTDIRNIPDADIRHCYKHNDILFAEVIKAVSKQITNTGVITNRTYHKARDKL